MNRRRLFAALAALPALAGTRAFATTGARRMPEATLPITKLELPDAEWKKRLTTAQYQVLRHEGTERAWTSALNEEKRSGTYVCAGCDLPLYRSEMKFDSGTGWPSFYTAIPGVFETRRDFRLLLPRTEYHCARCGGHHGHVFNDGPAPTGQRWCNNGVALKFVAEQA
jgi:peptide-methionine (R)-S-oxide reductase